MNKNLKISIYASSAGALAGVGALSIKALPEPINWVVCIVLYFFAMRLISKIPQK